MRPYRAVFGALLLLVTASGCALTDVPSPQHPLCSWTSQLPSNHEQLCRQAYGTVRALAAAAAGHFSAVRRIVPAASVATRIIAWSRSERAQGLTSLRVTADLTLGFTAGGYLGVGFNMVVTTRSGSSQAPQQLYLRLKGSQAVVVGDQPDQEW